ncbi:orotidine-5'-phosphate decarboxylase [Sabulicella glaciei]|uniref:Orotidine 5'-phosphate decarboxylase n=1 Tax=Sabulicella glaciei TaxID=2984948 RepID=A0ABT3NZ62_9PROT|nr:orotidine-5'-phosphate decarboxylase [Roseococcus sp. MDT2-1-1]MCW8087452.1 orotidine-5'-phosphate decarboxylase [Roseococcus sp. MDT2-1-1]
MISRPSGPAGRLIVALDVPEAARAESLAHKVAPHAGLVKLGLELFCAEGPGVLGRLARAAPVFLDLKLHDIPNTVAGAVRSLAPLGASMLTLHAGGGPAMIAAAREAAEKAGRERPLLLAVTVLTSMDEAALEATGVSGGAAAQVVRLARMAVSAGADGLVCSPREIRAIRDSLGEAPALVVPGIRPAGAAAGDQSRVATPEEAVRDGADWIVVGRPVSGAGNPGEAARAITAGLPR